MCMPCLTPSPAPLADGGRHHLERCHEPRRGPRNHRALIFSHRCGAEPRCGRGPCAGIPSTARRGRFTGGRGSSTARARGARRSRKGCGGGAAHGGRRGSALRCVHTRSRCAAVALLAARAALASSVITVHAAGIQKCRALDTSSSVCMCQCECTSARLIEGYCRREVVVHRGLWSSRGRR